MLKRGCLDFLKTQWYPLDRIFTSNLLGRGQETGSTGEKNFVQDGFTLKTSSRSILDSLPHIKFS